MSRPRLLSGEYDFNDLETSSVLSKGGSSVSGRSETVRALNDRLRLESKSRQETDELYKRLQHEYDDLLARHAQAENTIDQLKIGAKIKLYCDDKKPLQASQVRFVDVKSQPVPTLTFPRSGHAVISSDQLSNTQDSNNSARHYQFADSSVELDFLNGAREDNDRQLKTILRLKELQGDIEAFQTALGERELDYIQQRSLFQALAGQHEQLKADLLKYRYDGNDDLDTELPEKRRFPEEFVTPDSLEGEIYRIGLKLEEISDEISEQLQTKDKGDPLNQYLLEDFENVKRSQSLGGTKSLSGEDQGVAADAIVQEVILKDPRKSQDVFSGSEETDLVVHTPRNRITQILESEQDSSISSHPYARPTCAWEPGVEDLTESDRNPSKGVNYDESKSRSSAIGSLYLARSPSLDIKDKVHRARSSRAPSSAKSTEGSSAGFSPRKGFPSSRESVESVVYCGDDTKERRTSRSKDLDTSYGSIAKGKGRRESVGSAKLGRSRCSSISQAHHSDSSFVSDSPRQTSSPKKEIGNELKELVHGRNQRYLHSRPGSEGKRTSEKFRARKDVLGKNRSRSLSGDQRLTDYEETSSSEKESSSEADCRRRGFNVGKVDRLNGKSGLSKTQYLKESKSDRKGFRPNTADSNVDSGFVGSEDSRRSNAFPSTFRGSNIDKVTPMTSSVQSPRRSSLDSPPKAMTASSRKSSYLDRSDLDDHTVPIIPYKTPEQKERPRSGKHSFTERSHKASSVRTPVLSVNGESPRAYNDLTLSPQEVKSQPRASSFQDQETPEVTRRVSLSSAVSREVPSSTGELYRYRLDRLREKTPYRPPDRRPSYIANGNEELAPNSLSTVEESECSRKRTGSVSSPKSGRHNETQTRAMDEESGKSERHRRYSFDLLRDEVQRLRSQLADESRIRSMQSQWMEDMRMRQAEMDRQSNWKAAEERQKEMLSDIRRRLDKLSDEVKTPKSFKGESDLSEHRQLYNDVRGKIDNLSREIQRSKDRTLTVPDPGNLTRHTTLNPTPNIVPVCPVCSGVGYHRHGNYIFPRDFLRSNSPVQIVPTQDITQDIYSLPVTPEPAPIVTSTPVNHLGPKIRSPLPTYRVISSQPTALYPSPNTIYHIHKHHKTNEESSSSDESSGSEMGERRRKRRSTRRLKNSQKRWNGSELQDLRLHESLNEATKAAREMQRVSKKMLNTIATDLIQVGMNEY